MWLLAPQASEFLLQECVVLCTCLVAFQPLHVVLDPRVMAFRRKAREGVLRRSAEVHQATLGTLREQAPLPILGLLKAMLTLCQIPKLPTGFGVGDGLHRGLEGLTRLGDQGLGLAVKDFLCHLRDALLWPH